MKKLNKIMLLSITAFVPLATVVACSKTASTEEKKVTVTKSEVKTMTVADTTVLLTVSNLATEVTKADLTLHVVGKTDATKKGEIVASELKDGVATFKFTTLTAETDYKLDKLVVKGATVVVPTGTTAEFKVTAAAATTTGGTAAGTTASAS